MRDGLFTLMDINRAIRFMLYNKRNTNSMRVASLEVIHSNGIPINQPNTTSNYQAHTTKNVKNLLSKGLFTGIYQKISIIKLN